jgi:hypothetical protein
VTLATLVEDYLKLNSETEDKSCNKAQIIRDMNIAMTKKRVWHLFVDQSAFVEVQGKDI